MKTQAYRKEKLQRQLTVTADKFIWASHTHDMTDEKCVSFESLPIPRYRVWQTEWLSQYQPQPVHVLQLPPGPPMCLRLQRLPRATHHFCHHINSHTTGPLHYLHYEVFNVILCKIFSAIFHLSVAIMRLHRTRPLPLLYNHHYTSIARSHQGGESPLTPATSRIKTINQS